jgi:16S rRNA (guanine1207-N2)-methyltransferase
LSPRNRLISCNLNGIELTLETDPSLFSPARTDRGTLALLSTIILAQDDKVLDLGCGYGLVGIHVAKVIGGSRVWMSDNDEVALEFTRRNLAINGVSGAQVVLSDGFRDLKETNFTKIIFNPPYHVDFSVPKHFIEKGFNRLVIGGEMYLVTKRKTWYANKLKSIFGGCRTRNVDSYFVVQATKKTHSFARSVVP